MAKDTSNQKSFMHRFKTDKIFRGTVSFYLSFMITCIYSVWEIACGIYYSSFWFITMGAYYIILVIMRMSLLRTMHKKGEEGAGLWKSQRVCGVLILFMDIILAGIVSLAVREGDGMTYAGYLIYAVALYTFWRVVIAIKNLIQFVKIHEPVMSTSKVISLVSALVSLLSLEIAMIQQFGSDPQFFTYMTIGAGCGVFVLITAAAIAMIVLSHKYKEVNTTR